MLPAQIGKDRVVRALGRGAMGDVYLGEDPLIGRQVAIKMLRQEDPEGRLRFLQEARVVGAFSHPNIVVVHEFGFEGDEPFLAMEFLPGESLDGWLQKPRTLQAQLRVVRGLAEALDYAHAQGVLHRDVKPGNVQVLPDGQCKLMDFGIARAALGRLTATGTVMGTPNYIAPETLSAASYSERSDLYSAAVVFYEMFAGRNPFAAPTVAACLHNVLHVDPEPLARARPDLPAALGDAIMECLDKDPARRPDSFARLRAAIQAVERGAASSLPASAGETRALPRADARPAPSPRRARLVLAAVVLAGAVALWLGQRAPAPRPAAQPAAASARPPETTRAPLAAAPTPEASSRPAVRTPLGAERRPASPLSPPSPTTLPSATAATPAPALDPSPPPPTLPSAPPATLPAPEPTPKAPEAAAPMLSGLKPSFVRRGAAVRLELRGSGFGPGLKLLVLHGDRPAAGLRLTGVRVRDASHATATLVVDGDVALDSYVVVAKDGDATSNGLSLEVQL